MSCLCFDDEKDKPVKILYEPQPEVRHRIEKSLQAVRTEVRKEVVRIMEEVQNDFLGFCYQGQTGYTKVYAVEKYMVSDDKGWSEFIRMLRRELLLAFGTWDNGQPRASAEYFYNSDVRIQATWPAGWIQAPPTATVGLDVNGDGRADYIASGVDRNRDGIPDFLQRGRRAPPMAAVGIDVNGDGRADYIASGVDRNRDGIPDFLQRGRGRWAPPRATVGLDVNGDGRADYFLSGVDRNRDGIPDFLQRGRARWAAPRATVGLDVNGDGRADYFASGVDWNRDGIPDYLQRGRYYR